MRKLGYSLVIVILASIYSLAQGISGSDGISRAYNPANNAIQVYCVAATCTGAGGSGLTDTQLRASALHIIIDSSASLAVTGPLTDTQLRANPVPISGSISNTSFNVGNFPATQPVTVTNVALTPILVSSQAIGLPLQPCNAVRRNNCQHF